MTTPSTETLDAICVLITGDEDAKFARVTNPVNRAEIVRMALHADSNTWLESIDVDLDELRQWFHVSRPYEGS